MLYYTVEGAVFNAWCTHNLPMPRGGQIGRTARFQGMVVAIPSLLDSELMAWINRRDFLASDLGDAFVPDQTLVRNHFYERARERLTAPRLGPQIH
jgi:hypothetical protein